MKRLEEIAPRYRKVARRVGAGMSYQEAAEELGISVRTVEHYVAELADSLEADHLDGLSPKARVMVWWHVDVQERVG